MLSTRKLARTETEIVFVRPAMKQRDADWQLRAHGWAMHAFTKEGAASPEHGMAYDADANRHSWVSTVAFLAELFGNAA